MAFIDKPVISRNKTSLKHCLLTKSSFRSYPLMDVEALLPENGPQPQTRIA